MTTDIKITETDDGRRTFHIDIGDIPTKKVMEYIERIKEEIRTKKLPI